MTVALFDAEPFWEEDGLPLTMWTDTPLERLFPRRHRDTGDCIGLKAFVNGAGTVALDRLDEAAFERLALATLERIRPHATGRVRYVARHAWGADPFAGGAYAAWPPGGVAESRAALLRPAGRVRFRGRARRRRAGHRRGRPLRRAGRIGHTRNTFVTAPAVAASRENTIMNEPLTTVCLAALALVLLCPATARELDPNDPADALTVSRKIMCSTVDGEATTFWWEGRAFSRRQGEPDRHLFDVEGMNVRACMRDTHAERGAGFRLVSRELLIYRDRASGEALATWENPWTGATVEVLHVANDPVNFAMYERGPRRRADALGRSCGRRAVAADHNRSAVLSEPAWRRVPAGGGGHLPRDGDVQLLRQRGGTARLGRAAGVEPCRLGADVGLAAVDEDGRPRGCDLHAHFGPEAGFVGRVARQHEGRDRAHYPDYTEPPALDDTRPNVTSWIYYRRVREGAEQAPAR